MVELSESEHAGPSGRPGVPWRLIGPTVLVPNLLNSLGQSAAITAVPLAASALTRSYAVAALVTALITLGQLSSTLPAGWVVDRFGERAAMAGSTAVTALGGLLAYAGSSIPLLGLGATLIGAGVSVFAMARHTWITVAVPMPVRGRTLSAVAGFTRLGNLLGPFLTAAALQVSGRPEAAFLIVVGTSVAPLVPVVIARFPETPPPPTDHDRHGVLGTLWDRRRTLVQPGLTVSVISSMRTGRRALVPLVGVSLGWDDVSTALLLGLTGTLDFAVCYLGGSLTDQIGRIHVAVGTLIAFGLTHFVVAVALVAPAGDVLYIAGVAVMSMANGISGGLVPRSVPTSQTRERRPHSSAHGDWSPTRARPSHRSPFSADNALAGAFLSSAEVAGRDTECAQEQLGGGRSRLAPALVPFQDQRHGTHRPTLDEHRGGEEHRLGEGVAPRGPPSAPSLPMQCLSIY